MTENQIEWGYNCLTAGIHHGRPEEIWNIPLLYAATVVFQADVLKEMVISRIYNDAMQYVKNPDPDPNITEKYILTQAWADRVKAIAEENYDHTLTQKVGEIDKYYKSAAWRAIQRESAARVTRDTLNPSYAPLHPHDTINLLCRIIGVSASMRASEEQGKV